MAPILKISFFLTILLISVASYPQNTDESSTVASSTDKKKEEDSSSSSASVENEEEGTNICAANEGCHCTVDVSPVEMNCEKNNLKLIYEQSDWLATVDKLNLKDNYNLTVIFDYNQITNVSRFSQLPIVSLYLAHNLISNIEDFAFAELKQLQSLHLNNNNLTGHALTERAFTGGFNETEGNYPLAIKFLNLSHNRIHSIGKDVFDHLRNLRSLDLSNNPLKTLEGSTSNAISSLRKLEYLGLAFTQVEGMHKGMLHDLNGLTGLDLSGNEFTKVPEELRWAVGVTMLRLDRNKFESLDGESFKGLGSLQELSLKYNEKLKSVEEGTFGWLKNLTVLDLSFCRRLENLNDAAFLGLVDKENMTSWPVKEIRLNDNGLSQVDEGLAPWDEVDYIDIRNNPFRCDCNLEWMMKYLVPKIEKISPVLTDGLDCAKPQAFRGKSLVELMLEMDRFSRCKDSKDELYSEEISLLQPTSYRAAGVTIIVIVVILTILGSSLVVFILVKRRAIAKALVQHQEIRYERAESDDDGIGSVHSSVIKSGKRTNVF